ncbi:outer membrane beta-barrel protein [Bizionia gelidisalsuginis]|uniref:Outer membrane beta-barrel protein n=2 Tax=Bizionia TaxID=283785 RepID=A0A8H2QIW2_9FLAO|nr:MULTISPECIES: outer membrane beta-barrel protein [Bizionia]TYB72617.1 outer membrane beta-barrel protein [Bizionia saleffrena]TYC18142.1 outer membrane beta-barrel protein [Bizionia gelidisalsuginis]
MKKIILCAAVAVFGFLSVSAQGQFKVGANIGLPVGDFSDFYSLSAGLDVAYLVDVSDQFKVGAATGFMNVFGEDLETTFGEFTVTAEAEDAQFVPLAAAARFMASDNFYVGADLGYAIAVDSEGEGGLYYRPRVGYNFTEMIGVNLSYTGISNDGNSLNSVGLGVELSF